MAATWVMTPASVARVASVASVARGASVASVASVAAALALAGRCWLMASSPSGIKSSLPSLS